ncbi:MAG: glycosyltransferase family 9 protein [Elusimicrobiales bacterium]
MLGKIFRVKKYPANLIKRDFECAVIRKILIIRQNQGIGDMVLLSPVIRALKQSSYEKRVDMLVSEYNYPAVKGNPNVTRFYIWKKSCLFNWLRILRDIRKENYDIVIGVWSHTPSFTTLLYALLSGSKRTVSYNSFQFNKTLWSRYMISCEIDAPSSYKELERFRGLVSFLGLNVDERTEFHIEDEYIEAGKKFYFELSKPKVGIFLGGNSKRTDRLWRTQGWAEIVRKLIERKISVVAVVPPKRLKAGGGEREVNFYDEVCRKAGFKIPKFSHSDIMMVGAFIKNLDVFVCPDGGIFHISVACGVKTVGIFIKTDSKRWSSDAKWVSCVQSADGTACGVSCDDVFKAVLRFLE